MSVEQKINETESIALFCKTRCSAGDAKLKKVIPKNAYEYWYMRMGGNNYKGELPRGNKFKSAISKIKSKSFICASKKNRLIRKPRELVLFDETDKFI